MIGRIIWSGLAEVERNQIDIDQSRPVAVSGNFPSTRLYTSSLESQGQDYGLRAIELNYRTQLD